MLTSLGIIGWGYYNACLIYENSYKTREFYLEWIDVLQIGCVALIIAEDFIFDVPHEKIESSKLRLC